MSDYVRLKKSNKYLALCGAPVSVLSSRDKENFGYRVIQSTKYNITIAPDIQKAYYDAYISGDFDIGSNSLIVIGCDTLISGQKMAANIASKYIEDYPTPFPFVKWVNLAYHDFDYFKDSTERKGVVVIPSVDKHADSKRIQLANDYIRCSEGATIIVVIETPDAITFAMDNMGLQPDAIIQLGRATKTRTRI